MGKRGVILLAALLLINIVSAAHSATVNLNPLTVFETTSNDYNLTVNNYGSQDVITDVLLDFPGANISSVVNYAGWVENYSYNYVHWDEGSIETNVLLALFEFTANAPKVTQNTTSSITLRTTDDKGGEQTRVFTLTVINDDTPPVLTNPLPQNGTIVLEAPTTLSQIEAIDTDTGIEYVVFDYRRCSDNTTTVDVLSKNNNIYNKTIDISSFSNNNKICFEFRAENKGGSLASYPGVFYVDGEEPSVSLFSPADNAFLNNQSLFEYIASDNLAADLSCTLTVDGNQTASMNASSGATSAFSASVAAEGTHEWNVECEDDVGLRAEGEQRTFTLDKTSPIINAIPGDNSFIITESRVSFNVTDNYGVDSVQYTVNGNSYTGDESFSVLTSLFNDGINTITVTATDIAGNIVTQDFTYIIDKTAPQVILIAPINQTDVHVNFMFNAVDTYDPSLSCNVLLDSNPVASLTTANGTNNITAIVALGTYNYKVECVDDSGNYGVSSERTINVIDLTGPDIEIESIGTAFRGDNVPININITDISGVAMVAATITDPSGVVTVLNLTQNGDIYSNIMATTINSELGNYTIDVIAEDTLANLNTAQQDFMLTYKYTITLTLLPNPAKPSDLVTAEGDVLMDNGSLVPEGTLQLQVAGNNATDVSINQSSGHYIQILTAPSAGDYDITASVTSQDNGVTYSATEVLEVKSPQSYSSHASSKGSGKKRQDSGEGDNGDSGFVKKPDEISKIEDDEEESGHEDDERENLKKKPTKDSSSGIGSATGFFNNLKADLWWLLVLLGILLASLYWYAKNDDDEDDEIGLEKYLKERL